MAKQKQYKLKFKPTPISRLSKWKIPIPMKGDPKWWDGEYGPSKFDSLKDAWKAREQPVYLAMCEAARANLQIRELINEGAAEYEKILQERELGNLCQVCGGSDPDCKN